MPKHKKNVEEVATPGAISRKPKARRNSGRNRTIFIIASIVVVVLAIAIPVYFQTQAAPFQQAVVTVDKSVIRMNYFLKRVKMGGNNPSSTLQQLVDEELVKEMAPTFGITVTQQEVDNSLLYTASTENLTTGENFTGSYLTESQYKVWLNQQIKNTGLTAAEYNDMARTNVLASKLQTYLAQRVPTTAAQIHLNVIVVAS